MWKILFYKIDIRIIFIFILLILNIELVAGAYVENTDPNCFLGVTNGMCEGSEGFSCSDCISVSTESTITIPTTTLDRAEYLYCIKDGNDKEYCDKIFGVTTTTSTPTTTIKPSCFPADTPISTPNGNKNIQDIKVGDVVYGYDNQSGKIIETKVKKTIINKEKEYLIINEINVTPRHQFYIDGKWIAAEEIKIGDRLLLQNLSYETVKSIKRILVDDSITVYNFDVEGPSNFFAGGVLVHNGVEKSPTQTATSTTISRENAYRQCVDEGDSPSLCRAIYFPTTTNPVTTTVIGGCGPGERQVINREGEYDCVSSCTSSSCGGGKCGPNQYCAISSPGNCGCVNIISQINSLLTSTTISRENAYRQCVDEGDSPSLCRAIYFPTTKPETALDRCMKDGFSIQECRNLIKMGEYDTTTTIKTTTTTYTYDICIQQESPSFCNAIFKSTSTIKTIVSITDCKPPDCKCGKIEDTAKCEIETAKNCYNNPSQSGCDNVCTPVNLCEGCYDNIDEKSCMFKVENCAQKLQDNSKASIQGCPKYEGISDVLKDADKCEPPNCDCGIFTVNLGKQRACLGEFKSTCETQESTGKVSTDCKKEYPCDPKTECDCASESAKNDCLDKRETFCSKNLFDLECGKDYSCTLPSCSCASDSARKACVELQEQLSLCRGGFTGRGTFTGIGGYIPELLEADCGDLPLSEEGRDVLNFCLIGVNRQTKQCLEFINNNPSLKNYFKNILYLIDPKDLISIAGILGLSQVTQDLGNIDFETFYENLDFCSNTDNKEKITSSGNQEACNQIIEQATVFENACTSGSLRVNTEGGVKRISGGESCRGFLTTNEGSLLYIQTTGGGSISGLSWTEDFSFEDFCGLASKGNVVVQSSGGGYSLLTDCHQSISPGSKIFYTGTTDFNLYRANDCVPFTTGTGFEPCQGCSTQQKQDCNKQRTAIFQQINILNDICGREDKEKVDGETVTYEASGSD